MTFDINLNWHSFNLDLGSIETWVKANADANYVGMSANSQLQLHYSAQPDDSVIAAVDAYWSALASNSAEALAYQSASDRDAAAAAEEATALASATSKLTALGLTDAEIAALRG